MEMHPTFSGHSATEYQDLMIEKAKNFCVDNYGLTSLTNLTKPIFNATLGWMCPAYFDEIMCWPPTKAGALSIANCPNYVLGFDLIDNATKMCTDEGKWFINQEYGRYWTNYTPCYTIEQATVIERLPNINVPLIEEYFPKIKIISRTGYTVSFCTLLVAFIIMFFIKKLHCPRNKLHMHLFASFILRAGLSLLKDLAFIEGVGLASDVKYKNGRSYFFVDIESNNWGCKFLTSLWEFFITANYSWILMEGLYLHNLIFRALFADPSRNITHYIILGWGMPIMVIVAWIISRVMIDDKFCWTVNSKQIFLIIRIPTMISIIINLILFVRIAAVIFSKLQAPVYEEAQRYKKWARSTLVLVPLFGIHYAIFLGMSFYIGKNELIELIWLIGDQTFASFQGFFVAVLYCFLNGEVRTELKPHIHSLLMCCATNSCMQYIFPCRDRYLRSARGRTSVCTTMSCSSLYNNGINHHRNSKTRWDITSRPKLSFSQDRNRDHICRPNVKYWHDMPTRWNNSRNSHPNALSKPTSFQFCSNGSLPAETTLSINNSQPPVEEENQHMLNRHS